MKATAERDIGVLNGLLETTLDSADGYGEAAEEARNSRYKTLFEARAAERRAIVSDIRMQVAQLGGAPASEGTILASAHRMFLSLRNSLAGDDKTVIDEVESGEDHIKGKYEDAMARSELSPDVLAFIRKTYVTIKAGHDQMRDLKRATTH